MGCPRVHPHMRTSQNRDVPAFNEGCPYQHPLFSMGCPCFETQHPMGHPDFNEDVQWDIPTVSLLHLPVLQCNADSATNAMLSRYIKLTRTLQSTPFFIAHITGCTSVQHILVAGLSVSYTHLTLPTKRIV